MHNIHDGIFRLSFSNTLAVAGFMEMTFPKEILEKIRLETLYLEPTTYLDKNLRKYYSDIVYSCELKNSEKVHLNFVFEHKSYLPDNPELQLLIYMALGYMQQKRVQKEQKVNEPLTQIIPVLLYHGTTKYKPKHLFEYMQTQDETLRKYVPEFELLLVNLANYTDEQIAEMKFGFFMRSVLLLFKHKNDKQYVLRNSEKIFIFVEKENLAPEKKDEYVRFLFLYIVKTYNMNIQEIDEIVEHVSDQARGAVMSGYEALIQKGEIKGEIKGRYRGRKFTSLIKDIILVKTILKTLNAPTEVVATICKQPKEFVVKIKTGFIDADEQKARKVAAKLFKTFGELDEDEKAQLEVLFEDFLRDKK